MAEVAAKTQSVVSEIIDDLKKVATSIEDSLCLLADTFDSCLKPEKQEPEPDEPPGKDPVQTSKLTEDLTNMRRRLYEIDHGIREICDRSEL